MSSIKDEHQEVFLNRREQKLDLSTTFLQIPIDIKDKVLSFIDGITGPRSKANDGTTDFNPILQTSGCFFVISLEKIEELMKLLETGLSYSDNEVDKVKDEIQKALKLLQGQ